MARGMLAVIAASAAAAALAGSPWPAQYTQQAAAILAKMSQADKLSMVHGTGKTYPYVGMVPALPQYGLPPLNLEDGPQGVADGAQMVTCWPSALTVAQSWDPDAMYEWGMAMGQEQHAKGTNVMLGPGVNLARVPWGGRNFEYLGEDPWLASRMVAAEVAGIQSQNISGCVKHFIDNNQEYNRNTVSENVPQRVQMELYFQPFLAAVDAGVGSAMCSYNRINSTYACENNVTLGYLKDPARGGFRGWVMSDWGATHSTVQAALAGLDQQMPDASYFGSALAAAVTSGAVPQSRIDDMVMRMLTPMAALGLLADQPTADRNITANATAAYPWHGDLARRIAERSITLLKNGPATAGDAPLLPVNPAAVKTIAVLGDATTVHGGGSGGVNTPYIITPAQGLANVAAELGINGLNIVSLDGTNITAAAAAAAAADIALVVVATSSHEGADRANLSLPAYQDALVAAVLAAQPKTVVSARCPGACLMPWAAAAPAILFELMPGQEAGNALAAAFFGAVNPGGKLPVSFPTSMNGTWLSQPVGGPINPMQWPGTDRGQGFLEADYTEGIFFGYRWFDAQNIAPLWPFGHGLSYSTFSYSNLAVAGSLSSTSNATIYATVCNTAGPFGDEVAQLYLGYPSAAANAPKVLKGFSKLHLPAGACAAAGFELSSKDVAIWDVTAQAFVVQPGSYAVYVGSSSRDIRLTGSLSVSA